MIDTRNALPIVIAGVLALAAGCGGSSPAPSAPASSTTPVAVLQTPPRTSSKIATQATGPTGDGAIVVTAPLAGARVSSGIARIRGNADVFEAALAIDVLDSAGRVVGHGTTLATCGTGCRGTFTVRVHYRVGRAQSGTIVVHDTDARGDGTPPHQVWLPVELEP